MAMTRSAALLFTGLLAAGLTAAGCSQALKFMKDDSAEVLSKLTITAPNPADRGPHTVKTMFYGSGTDKQRVEYRTGVTIKTKAVDVTPFATVTGDPAKVRKEFFGFELKAAPINGRVWYPD